MRGLAGDRRGTAAIEFAFIAPLLIIFYMGMTETCQLLMAKRRVDHVSAAVADLVSQNESTSKSALTDTRAVAATVLAPFSTDGLVVKITSVAEDANGALKQKWCWPTACAVDSAPAFAVATPLNAGESVVVAEVAYTYTSAAGYLITSGRELTHKAELRPRKNDQVLCPDCAPA